MTTKATSAHGTIWLMRYRLIEAEGGAMRKCFAAIVMAMVASSAAAVPLDLGNANGIAALYVLPPWPQQAGQMRERVFVVCSDGRGYRAGLVGSLWGWADDFIPSPVPLAEVADWTPWILYTTDGRWFKRDDALGAWEAVV